MKNKYLITGSSGFVAYYFLEYLNELQDKFDVLCIDTIKPNYSLNNTFDKLDIKFVSINLLDYDELNKIIITFKPNYILHLASFSSVAQSWLKPIESFMNNTNIFLNLIEIIRLNNIKCRILSIGSSEEYGNVKPENIPLKEDSPLNPVNPYAIARVSQELLSQCYVKSLGMDIILTRSFNHIGPKQSEKFVIPSFVKQIILAQKNNETIVNLHTGDINLIRDFIDVRDVVKAYYLLFKHGTSGELYNVCTGNGKSLKDIIGLISELTSIKIKIIVDNNLIRPNDNKIIIGDNTKIINHIGWLPLKKLDSSLSEIITHWKNI